MRSNANFHSFLTLSLAWTVHLLFVSDKMYMKMDTRFFFVAFASSSLVFLLKLSPSTSDEVSNSQGLIIQVYESLFAGLNYLEERKKELILDSAMGVRIVIDQSKYLIPLTDGIHRRMLHQLNEKARKVLHESLPYVIQSDLKTFKSKLNCGTGRTSSFFVECVCSNELFAMKRT